MDDLRFTIKAVAERTGVPEHTLRAWERRYGVPLPHRGADNRYRLYGEQDIADVLFLKQQVESGVAPSQASLLLRQQHNQSAADSSASSALPIDATRDALVQALAASDERVARMVLDQAFAMFSPEQVALGIVEPTMHEIGDRWMRSDMTVWQEHLASNVVEQRLFAILQSLPAPSPSAPLLAAACAPSEEHELGLVILALLARRQGWRVAYLGRDTPLGDLVSLAHTSKPSVIAVSVTTVIGLAHLIPWLRAENRPPAPLVLGGRLPNLLPALREHLPGQYLGSDAPAAVNSLSTAGKRADEWSPSKRMLDLVGELQAQRLTIAGEIVTGFIALTPNSHPNWDALQLNYATLFLFDSLACALAFDVPDLVDLQHAWLNAAMPSRAVPPQMIDRYLQLVASALAKQFSPEQFRSFSPLLARLKN